MSEPVEKLLGRWADSPNDKTRPSCVEVDSFATPSFPWFRRAYQFSLYSELPGTKDFQMQTHQHMVPTNSAVA